MAENRIGFHVRSRDELTRFIAMKEVDVIELKPHRIKENSSENLYYFDGKEFKINEEFAKELKYRCIDKDISVHIHLPYETKCDPSSEDGLCQAVREHHELLIERFKMIGELHQKYGIGDVITIHPPAFRLNGKNICTRQEALDAGREFYAKLEMLITQFGHEYEVGIENAPSPRKNGISNIGNKPQHIDYLIGNNSEIGITIDTGRRRLGTEKELNQMISCAPIVSAHFHSNLKKYSFSEGSEYEEEHVLATVMNFPKYQRYIKEFRRRKIPIIIEVENLNDIKKKDLSNYIYKLRERIDKRDY